MGVYDKTVMHYDETKTWKNSLETPLLKITPPDSRK